MSKICSIYFLLFFTVAAHGVVRHIPIKSGVVLQPGQAYTVQIDSSQPVEIGWTTSQTKPCSTNCIEATESLATRASALPRRSAVQKSTRRLR